MERLTYLKNPKLWDTGKHPSKYTSRKTFPEVVQRLAAYEDTGLEPEEIDQIKKAAMHMMFENVADFVRYAISNFEELQKYKRAEAEGRLVVLPCKVGDTVYVANVDWKKRKHVYEYTVTDCFLCKDGNFARMEMELSAGSKTYYVSAFEDFGKTVFFAREAAEAALKTQSAVAFSEKIQLRGGEGDG